MPKRSNSRSGGPGRRWNDHDNYLPIESISVLVCAGAEGPQWFAGCGMLVAGGFCYRMLVDDGPSLVSRRMHRLLRVPPTGSSASGDGSKGKTGNAGKP